MAFILAVETATKVCSVALFENNRLLSVKEEKGNYSHAENVAVFAEEILQKNKIEVKDLSAIAVSKGPGSYTGLRIGVSFVKGLCYSNKIPLISVATLKNIAWGFSERVSDGDALICPMIDARRMEVYSMLFDKNLQVKETIAANIISENSYKEWLRDRKVYFLGDGAEKCSSIIEDKNAIFVENEFPSASKMGTLAFDKFRKGEFENVAYFEPYYLKEFIALKGKKIL